MTTSRLLCQCKGIITHCAFTRHWSHLLVTLALLMRPGIILASLEPRPSKEEDLGLSLGIGKKQLCGWPYPYRRASSILFSQYGKQFLLCYFTMLLTIPLLSPSSSPLCQYNAAQYTHDKQLHCCQQYNVVWVKRSLNPTMSLHSKHFNHIVNVPNLAFFQS